MPRRSTRQTSASTPEQTSVRVTRRSIRGQKTEKEEEEVPPSPAKSDTSKTSRRSTKSAADTSPPTKSSPSKGSSPGSTGDNRSSRGRGRGRRGRSQSRGKGWTHKAPEEEDSEEEVDEIPSESGDQEFEPKSSQQAKSRGRGRAAVGSPRSRRGQQRKSHTEEDEEEEYQPGEEEVKKLKTPSPRKTTRKGRSAAKEQEQEEDESPRRRSGRRAAKEAEEKIRTDAAAEEASKEDEEEPMETESSEAKLAGDKEDADKTKQLKRKHNEVDQEEQPEEKAASPAKKLKTDSSLGDDAKSTDESMPNIEEISEDSAGEEASREGGGVTKKAEPMEEAPILEAEPKSGETAKVDEPSKKGDSSTESKQAESIPAAEQKPTESIPGKERVETKPLEDERSQKSLPKKEEQTADTAGSGAQSTRSNEASEKGSMASYGQDNTLASHNQSSGKEAAEKTASSQSTPASKNESQDPDALKDYVVINMEDVPAPDSSEVSTSIPEVHVIPPDQDNSVNHGENKDGGSTTSQALTPTEAAPNKSAPVSHDAAANSVSSPIGHSATNNKQSSDCNNLTGSEHCVGSLVNNSSAKKDSQDPLLRRRFIHNPAVDMNSVPPEKTFTLVSYNILADCHAQRGEYKWISDEHLSVEYRHQRLMKELQFLDPDVICIQEIGPDHYNKLLQPQLAQLGYQGAFIKRPDDYFNEGEATFVRTSRFTILSNELIDLSSIAKQDLDNSGIDEMTLQALKKSVSSPGVAVITKVKCVKTGRLLTIGNVHIMWEWFKRMDIQCVQAAATIRELVTLAGGATQPHIVCGDFNSTPDSPVYQLTHEGYLNDSSMAKLQQLPEVKLDDGRVCPMVNLWWRGFQHTSTDLKSAYLTVTGKEPMTSKFPHDGVVRQVDYIWYSSGSLDVLGVAETAPATDIEQGIPNAIYPSDHVSTKAVLAFRN